MGDQGFVSHDKTFEDNFTKQRNIEVGGECCDHLYSIVHYIMPDYQTVEDGMNAGT